MHRLQTVWAFIRLGRVHFLVGGVLLHSLGIVMALYAGAEFHLAAVLWGQLAITATQLMTHYANDYFDLAADRANQTPIRWSGGSRVLVVEAVPTRVALVAALILGGTAFTANLVLSLWIRPGLMTFVLLFASLMLAWFYSAPPLRLHSRGLGELTTMLVVTLLTPLVGYYLQAEALARLPLLAVVPLCCFQVAMLLSIEFPDAEGDRQVEKNTLVVRLGAKTAARLYMSLILLVYAVLPLLVWAGLPSGVALAVLGLSPLALWQVWRASRGDWHNPARWNALAFYTIVLLMGTSAVELLTFILLIGL